MNKTKDIKRNIVDIIKLDLQLIFERISLKGFDMPAFNNQRKNIESKTNELYTIIDSQEQTIKELRQEVESLKCCGNCKPLDIFDCEGCKYCGNGDSDNWIKR